MRKKGRNKKLQQKTVSRPNNASSDRRSLQKFTGSRAYVASFIRCGSDILEATLHHRPHRLSVSKAFHFVNNYCNQEKKSFHGKSRKMGEKIKSWKFKKVMEKSWDFSTAYSEARMRNSDNSISIGYPYCIVLTMADFQFMFLIPNRNVRQE